MGSFANGLFTLMLGWLQSVFSFVWKAINASQGASFLQWLADHWILLVVLLCILGAGMDLAVYLVRWRPLQVWRSFFRRLQERKAAMNGPDPLQDKEQPESEATDEMQQAAAEKAKRRAAIEQEAELAYSYRESAEASLRSSRKRRFSPELFSENGLRNRTAASPQDVFNPEDTYHQPVYPRKWRNKTKRDESENESV